MLLPDLLAAVRGGGESAVVAGKVGDVFVQHASFMKCVVPRSRSCRRIRTLTSQPSAQDLHVVHQLVRRRACAHPDVGEPDIEVAQQRDDGRAGGVPCARVVVDHV